MFAQRFFSAQEKVTQKLICLGLYLLLTVDQMGFIKSLLALFKLF